MENGDGGRMSILNPKSILFTILLSLVPFERETPKQINYGQKRLGVRQVDCEQEISPKKRKSLHESVQLSDNLGLLNNQKT